MGFGLEEKSVVITGAAGGIGSATARAFLDAGAKLLLIDPNEETLTALKAELDADGRIATCVSDLRSPEACAAALETTSAPLYALVHLAGTCRSDPLEPQARTEAFDPIIASNLTNAYDMSIACIPRFDRESVCRIVLTSSLAFRRGSVLFTAYSAAKGGIVGLTRSLSRRLAPGVLVNGIAPGVIETPMAMDWVQHNEQKTIEQIPLNRLGRPREVANVVRFLCGDEASYITGQVINVDGGIMNA